MSKRLFGRSTIGHRGKRKELAIIVLRETYTIVTMYSMSGEKVFKQFFCFQDDERQKPRDDRVQHQPWEQSR